MLTLARARYTRGHAGEPLPAVFRTLADNDIHIRRGQYALFAAAPGVGKSAFVVNMLLKANVPALYFSADTDAFTTYLRAGAILTGWSTRDIETAVEAGNAAEIDARLAALDTLRFDFAGRIDTDDVAESLMAYAGTYGEFPHAIVADNLSNVDADSDPRVALDAGCDFLHEVARETGAAVIALHHVTGEFDNGDRPVPLSGLRGKVSKVPELVLTLYRNASTGLDGVGELYVCPVKNRTGRADPSGGWRLALRYEPGRMLIEDF